MRILAAFLASFVLMGQTVIELNCSKHVKGEPGGCVKVERKARPDELFAGTPVQEQKSRIQILEERIKELEARK